MLTGQKPLGQLKAARSYRRMIWRAPCTGKREQQHWAIQGEVEMLVQILTDNHIRGGGELAAEIQTSVEDALSRFAPQVTRVEVHLADENSHKGGDSDKTCSLEARIAGLQPIGATGSGANLDQAVSGALDKLVAQLDRKLGRLSDKKGRSAMGDEPAD
jgi:ribosome-associated translation inhibitor RaiA